MTVSEMAVQIALAHAAAGIRETSRNRGPEVDRYNRQVGLKPEGAYPWCTSGLYDVFLEASRELGVVCPFPKTAKAVRVWELLFERCLESNPAPGFVYVLAHGKAGDLLQQWKNDRYTSDGHIGIVAELTAQGDVRAEVSGNTNRAGSREGNCWAVHPGTPEVSHGGMLLGYLNLERLVVYP